MSIASARDELTSNLQGTGYNVFSYVPTSITPPAIVVTANDPYISPSETFGNEPQLNLQVICITPTKQNQQLTEAMDLMVESVLLNLGDWYFTVVSEPYYQIVNGAYRLSCIIEVNQNIELGN